MAVQVCTEYLSFWARLHVGIRLCERVYLWMQLHVFVCVRVHMCMCEWAQVDCELGRWTFGAALHPAAKRTHAYTHAHTFTLPHTAVTLTLCNSSGEKAVKNILSTSNHISTY